MGGRTLDQAIQHAEEKVQSGSHCGRDHGQLAEWLRELRDRRAAEVDRPTREEAVEALAENDALTADGFEGALVGYVERFNSGPLALYDRQRCIQILMERDGMDFEGAEEFFDFNVVGAWVGEGTPAFATLCQMYPSSSGGSSAQPVGGS